MKGEPLHAERKLAEKEFRITPQRRTVLKVLSSHQNRHLTAEQIYRIARAQGLKLGLTTVYRTLMDLERLGLVARLEIGKGPARYELTPTHTQPHYHLVCLRCGRISEVTVSIPEDF
ncbi:MAG: transcriptional repressor [Firmicutes bacterium]|nr:transcriptional repressor [Bacillota bacterium]